jgi:hypothetical protein
MSSPILLLQVNEFVTSIVPRSRAGSNSSLNDRLDALVIGCVVLIYPRC